MLNPFHQNILNHIKKNSGKPTQHTFLDSYLGNDHLRYPIAVPALRTIAKDWMRAHKDLSSKEFVELLTSLIEGKSSTEKSGRNYAGNYGCELSVVSCESVPASE